MAPKKTPPNPHLFTYHGDLPGILRLIAEQLETEQATAETFTTTTTADRFELRAVISMRA